METASPSVPSDSSQFDLSYANRALILFSGLVAIVLYIEGMLTPSLPSIASEFGVTIAQVSLVIALYAVSGTALIPIVGKLGDIYGKKRVLTYILVFYAAAVTVTGFSPNFSFMLGARAIQGIGLAIQPLAMSIIREEFPKDVVPRAQGILSGMFGVGFAVSLPLGALVSNDYGWRTTYHTAIPFVLLLALLVFIAVRESPYKRPDVKVDYIGATLLGLSLASEVLALGEGPSWGWTSSATLSLVVLGLLALVPLFAYERRYMTKGGEPILNLKLLSMRNVATSNFIFLVNSLGMFLAFQAFVYLFELPAPAGYHLDIFSTGLSLVPLAISLMIFAPLTGFVVSKVGIKRMAIPGALVGAAGFYLNALVTTYDMHLLFMFVAGAGLATTLASTINLLVLSVDPRDMGLATSMNTVFRNLGSSLGAPIAGSILSTFTISVAIGSKAGKTIYGTLPSSEAFQYDFYIAAAALVAVALIVIVAREVLGKQQIKPNQ
jgi:MFS family permease